MTELDVALGQVLSRQWGREVAVKDVTRLSGGASMETWLATVVEDGSGTPVILRRDRRGTPASSRLDEARLLELVQEAGVPVPSVLAAGAGGELETAYLVMEYVEGETIPRKILRDAHYERAREVLVDQVGAAVAGVHRVSAEAASFLGPVQTAEAQVLATAETLRVLGCDSPALELSVRWLLKHLPPSQQATLVHGDVRTGNLMVGPEGLRSLLDWELAHVGQPAEDLGWFCVRAWRFGVDQNPAGGLGTREQLLSAYHRAGGAEVASEVLRFWEVFGTLKWGATCLHQVGIHLRGDARSVELAAIGRRLTEVEYDLVLLMEESA